MIREKHKNWSLSKLLKIAQLSKSTFFYEISKSDKDEKNKELIDEIKTIFYENKCRYGHRRITAELKNRGITINHKKVLRLMNKLGLVAIKRKVKYRSYKGKIGVIAPNIIDRNFKADKPNKKWTTDVSQFNLPFGKCYLSPILDMCCGDIVAYDLSLSPNFEQTTRMLDEAFNKFPNLDGLVLHSDMGWQYQMKQYQKFLTDKGIIQSMSRKGNCYDNCIMESFFGTLKEEMFYGHESSFRTFDQFKREIDEYIDYYNNHRIKEKTKWMPPSVFRESLKPRAPSLNEEQNQPQL